MSARSDASYFAARAEESHAAMAAAADSGARLAHARMEAAYQALAAGAVERPAFFGRDPQAAADAPADMAPSSHAPIRRDHKGRATR